MMKTYSTSLPRSLFFSLWSLLGWTFYVLNGTTLVGCCWAWQILPSSLRSSTSRFSLRYSYQQVVTSSWISSSSSLSVTSWKRTHRRSEYLTSLFSSQPPKKSSSGEEDTFYSEFGDNDMEDIFTSSSSGNTSNIDWDAEWKKVVESSKSSSVSNADLPPRPAKGYYKSDAEVWFTKTVNRSARSVETQISKLPQMNTATIWKDGRVWILILAIVSVLIAVGTAPPQPWSSPSFGDNIGGSDSSLFL
jgi:hypothetical protein